MHVASGRVGQVIALVLEKGSEAGTERFFSVEWSDGTAGIYAESDLAGEGGAVTK